MGRWRQRESAGGESGGQGPSEQRRVVAVVGHWKAIWLFFPWDEEYSGPVSFEGIVKRPSKSSHN